MTRESSCSDDVARELARILRAALHRMDDLGYPPADPRHDIYTPDLTRVVGWTGATRP